MAGKDILASVKAVADLEQKQAELKAKYEREAKRIKDENTQLVNKLDRCRTHAVMSNCPNVVKALGYSHLLNITVDKIQSDDLLLKKLEGQKDFNIVFEDFGKALNALADLLYNREDLRKIIQDYIKAETGINHEQ